MRAVQAARRLVHPLYRRLESDVRPLRYLFAEITRRCNLDCLHCGSDCGRGPFPGEMAAREWIDFFAYLRDRFDRNKLMVVLTGGEPLCHPRFADLISALASNRLRWGMVSNGYALDQAALDLVQGRGLESLTISIDGLAASHDWLRNRKGSFDRAVTAVKRAARSGVPLFDVVTCVNPKNLAELPVLLTLVRELGVKSWRLFLIFPKGRARENPDLFLADDQVRGLMDWIARTRAGLKGENLRLDFSCEGFFPREIDRSIRDEPYFCRAGICIGSVLADGSISACPNIDRSLVQGNLRTDDFKSVWDQGFAPFRDREWMRQGPCVDCSHWSRCQGNSLHLYDPALGHTGRCYHRIFG